MADLELPVRRLAGADVTVQLDREWLVTNGLGGYASGTLCGAATRRYHGLLVAAHPAPLGRLMMLNHLTEQFRLPNWSAVRVGGVEKTGGLDVHGAELLTEFRLEGGLPVWTFALDGHAVEKRLFLPYRQNTVHVIYTLVSGPGPVRLKLRPSVHFRGHDDHVNSALRDPYTLTATPHRYELACADPAYPKLRLAVAADDASLTLDGRTEPDVLYRVEEHRGYERAGLLYSPGVFRATLRPGHPAAVTATTDPWERALALSATDALAREYDRRRKLIAAAEPAVRTGLGAELVLAADQFVITPGTRTADTARAHAQGDEARTIVAGYHWFTDWGRDTMISLEGLTLHTGRAAEARYILLTFAAHVRDGLIPNFFPDRENEGVYHTADATLWFFHALDRYATLTGDRDVIRELLPTLTEIIARHTAGTRFGIGVDPADGLLRQGAEGYQLTWMDAKVGDWVVTPRRGKAVEINALWYNALRLLAGWAGGGELDRRADQVRESFNRRFWNPATGCLFDVIDGPTGDDPAIRPNQVFAISLPHPVLDESRWRAVVDVADAKLLTPVGLRSLAPGHPDYHAKYFGDLRSRDAAYHQGTVWTWLIGAYADARAKAYPERADLADLLGAFDARLSEACVGTISEVFDAEPPHTPRACISQAWSVAEVLRLLATGRRGGGVA